MLGDKAYDSAELREELDEHATKSVIPNRSNRKQLVLLGGLKIPHGAPRLGCEILPYSSDKHVADGGATYPTLMAVYSGAVAELAGQTHLSHATLRCTFALP